MSRIIAGVDIGGTKCAVCIASVSDLSPGAWQAPAILGKERFPTPETPELAIESILAALEQLLRSLADPQTPGYPLLAAVGVSCGGPLDSRNGLILSPPNLPGWDRVDVLTPIAERFGVPAGLQNDANACALAEWRWGAGRCCRNMIFLTFGTGMGAGLILDGRLYSGTNDMAGEVGHVRLEKFGPVGYGKAGSFEGFCSGGGIAHLARIMATERLQRGQSSLFCRAMEDLPAITAEMVALAAREGDSLALEVFHVVGEKLGEGLSLLVDILNPERIVIGSIFARQRALMEPLALARLHEEALGLSLGVCQIVPAELGESVGDLAGLSVALEKLL